jgi:hypothetical protein
MLGHIRLAVHRKADVLPAFRELAVDVTGFRPAELIAIL